MGVHRSGNPSSNPYPHRGFGSVPISRYVAGENQVTLRLAILLDADRSREEISAMQRLAVALAGEGLNTVLGIADRTSEDQQSILDVGPIPRIHVPEKTPFWLRKDAARLASEQFESSFGNGSLDAIVLSGLGALDLGVRSSTMLQCPLIVEVRSRDEADSILKQSDQLNIVVAATEPLSNRLALKLGKDRVEFIRPCLPGAITNTSPEGRFLVILGPPQDPVVWNALLDGILDATSQLERDQWPMIAMELGESRADMQVWRHARMRGMLDQIVTFDQIDAMRPLLTSAAAIFIPEGRQPLRSILPQAMQRGVVPVVAQDPDMDFLQDGVNAFTINPSEIRRTSAWGKILSEVLNPDLRAPLAEAARIQSHEFLASQVAPQWATLLHSVVHGDTIPLEEN